MTVESIVMLATALRETDPATIHRLLVLSGIEMDFAFAVWLDSRDYVD